MILEVLIVTSPLAIDSLECYKCSNVTNLVGCNTLVVCQSGELCSSEFSTIGGERRYTLGCMASSSCPQEPTVGTGSSSIIGRSVISTQDTQCSECCRSGLCNRQLCQNYDPECVDNTNCSATGSFVNLCYQVDHAKNVCRRYCGLCSLIDGGWSHWSSWSACDSTCGNGTMTRTRTCNNPTPVNGGATCVGSRQESERCNLNRICPVHGGWSHWSPWGTCSATCDIGMQRRDRSCSQPYPAYGGDSCYGDSRDDRLCLPGACADGGWSTWGSWGSCSKSCGGGFRTRARTCDNPAPSIMGKYCDGQTLEVANCNTTTCQVHGGWSHWSPWGTCSATCDIGMQRRERSCSQPYPANGGDSCYGDGRDDRLCLPGACADGGWSTWGSWGSCSKSCDGGFRTRTRTCDNPAPSIMGKYCDGQTLEVANCNTTTCHDFAGPVVFYARDLSTLSPSWPSALIFTHVKTNVGNAYSSSTGIFTAPVNGTYSFSVQFCMNGPDKDAQVGLYINDVQYQSLLSYHDDCRTLSVSALLKLGDKVHVKAHYVYGGGQIFDQDVSYRINSFSGALVMRL